MDSRSLKMQHSVDAGTHVESNTAGASGFRPACLDKATGRVEVARLRNGKPAPAHLIAWLPRQWAAAMQADGSIVRVREGIIAGYVRDGVFLTREQALEL